MNFFNSWTVHDDPLAEMLRIQEEMRKKQQIEQQLQLAKASEAAVAPVALDATAPPPNTLSGFFETLNGPPELRETARDAGLRQAGLVLLANAASPNYAETLARAFQSYDQGREGIVKAYRANADDLRTKARQDEADKRAREAQDRAERAQERLLANDAERFKHQDAVDAAKAALLAEKEAAKEADKATAQAMFDAVQPEVWDKAQALLPAATNLAADGDIKGLRAVIESAQRAAKPPKVAKPTRGDENDLKYKNYAEANLDKLGEKSRAYVQDLLSSEMFSAAAEAVRSELKPKNKPPTVAKIVEGAPQELAALVRGANLDERERGLVATMMDRGMSLDDALRQILKHRGGA